jgi:hypothetical protein
MYDPEQQEDSSFTGASRLQQYLSQVGSGADRYRQATQQQPQQQPQGGLLDSIINRTSGRLPDGPSLPAYMKPPQVPNGAAGSPQYDLVAAQDSVRKNPKYQPIKDGDTFCNVATYEIAQRMGAPMDPFIQKVPVSNTYPKGQRPAMANELADHLANSSAYRVVTAQEAQALANQGKLVIGVQKDVHHGHVATVRPDNLYNEKAPNIGEGPVISTVGRIVGIHRAHADDQHKTNRAFLSGPEIYYTPVEPK